MIAIVGGMAIVKGSMANDSYRWWNGYRKGVDGK